MNEEELTKLTKQSITLADVFLRIADASHQNEAITHVALVEALFSLSLAMSIDPDLMEKLILDRLQNYRSDFYKDIP